MNALSVERLRLDFGGVRAVDDVTLAVGVGERRVILGPNGAGKTTLFTRLTVRESLLLAVQGADAIRFALFRRRHADRELWRRVDAMLAEWSLGARADMPTGDLSYGEQRQVELMLALAGRAKVLLLDEPTAGLSAAETAAVVATVARFPRDVTVLLIEHDMDVALTLADRVTVLHQGGVIADGTRDEIRADPRVAEIYLGPSTPARADV